MKGKRYRSQRYCMPSTGIIMLPLDFGEKGSQMLRGVSKECAKQSSSVGRILVLLLEMVQEQE